MKRDYPNSILPGDKVTTIPPNFVCNNIMLCHILQQQWQIWNQIFIPPAISLLPCRHSFSRMQHVCSLFSKRMSHLVWSKGTFLIYWASHWQKLNSKCNVYQHNVRLYAMLATWKWNRNMRHSWNFSDRIDAKIPQLS